MIVALDRPERARGAHIFEVAGAQELGAHHADERDPGEQQQDAEQDEEARRDDRRDDDQQIERRDRGPDLDEALEQQIDPAAEIALHRAGQDADDGGDAGEDQAEQHRDAEAVDEARHHVAALVVGAEPVPFDVAAARAAGALGDRLALLVGEHPGRRCRRGHGKVEVVRAVGEADRRPDEPAVLLDLLGDDRVAVIGLRQEAAEFLLRIVDEDRDTAARPCRRRGSACRWR